MWMDVCNNLLLENRRSEWIPAAGLHCGSKGKNQLYDHANRQRAALAVYSRRTKRQLAWLRLAQPLQTKGALSSNGQASSRVLKPLRWGALRAFTSRETVVGSLPMRRAMALKVIPLRRQV